MIRTSPVTWAALALAAAGLCGALLWEFAAAPSIDGSPAQPVSLQTARLPAGSQPGPQVEDWMREILARPVFSPDRRPVEATGKQAGGLRLAGIIVSELGRVAIFAKPSGARATIVREGGEIEGSKVIEVTETGVVLAGPSGRTVMMPVYDPAPRPRAPLPVPVPVKTDGRPN